jgi:hypothetical protein
LQVLLLLLLLLLFYLAALVSCRWTCCCKALQLPPYVTAVASAGDHMVCEFTCSCCGSSTAAAADALCSFLADGTPEALAGFSSRNGYTAVQVGASSYRTAAKHAVTPGGLCLATADVERLDVTSRGHMPMLQRRLSVWLLLAGGLIQP